MFSFFKNPRFILFITVLIVVPFIVYNLVNHQEREILGQNTNGTLEHSTSPVIATSGASPLLSPSPTALPKLSKSTYTIAVYGDSMVDTMGENLEYLQKALRAKYPALTFKFYNLGIGAQNIEQGLARWGQPFSYKSRNYPPIGQINADVIVLGSFAYNPFPNHDRNRHYLDLKELINRAKSQTPNVYLLAEIAPLKTGFGKGPGGSNWPEDLANLQAEHIVEQLENAVNISGSGEVFLINAYKESLYDGKFGNPVYVDSHDGIHSSVQGQVLVANLIAKTITLK